MEQRLFRPIACAVATVLLGAWLALGPSAASAGAAEGAGTAAAADLRCEYLVDPLGIDAASPRLSWTIESGRRGERQTAYQVLVASSAERLEGGQGDLWDPGKVDSDRSIQVAYAGKPLASGQDCFWKVRVWDRGGKPSAWSRPARWSMGLLEKADWHGQWIGRTRDTAPQPAPLLRKTFQVRGKVRRARIHAAGLGYHELSLNGRRVGDHILDPGYTRYDRRVLYVTHDVTGLLAAGENALGAVLGTGWYNVHTRAVWNFHEAPWRAAPKLLLELRIDFEDGRSETVSTDPTWKTSTGPIVYDSIYGGETYDARREKPGWDSPGYDDSGWEPALAVEAPRGILSAQASPPIRTTRTLEPAKVFEPRPGVLVYDMGQNFAGRARLAVSGPAGTAVTLRYAEKVRADGSLDNSNIAMHMVKTDPPQRFQTDVYVLKGSGEEVWESRFTYHGFQYVEVTCAPGKPWTLRLQGRPCHTDLEPAGSFECSNALLNRIWQATVWSYLSNFQSIPTDCPHREKNGWTGDAHLAAEQAMYNFFPPAAYAKWVNDLGDEQRPTGELPGIVPTGGWGYAWGNGPAWDSAFLIIPGYMYLYYGDTRILEQHSDGFRRYVDYLGTKADQGIVSIGLGDWVPYKTETPVAVTSTAYYFVDLRIASLAAGMLGKSEEARKYAGIAADVKKAFREKFLDPKTGRVANGSQTAQACALVQGLLERSERPAVLKALVENIERANGHIDTGILGAKYVLHALLEEGRADVAYRIASQEDFPGWGWWLRQGATTLWESWGGGDSRNHIMFGDVIAWAYKALAGIEADPSAPGFGKIRIRPWIVGGLTFARGEVRTIRGKVSSAWWIDGKKLRLRVTVPANASAEVCVPSSEPGKVSEGGKPAAEAEGVKFLREEAGRAVLEVGSGTYEFEGAWK